MSKAAVGTKFRMTLALPVGAVMNCADNSGAKNLFVIAVHGIGARLNRLPAAAAGDMVVASVKKGKPELRKKGKYHTLVPSKSGAAVVVVVVVAASTIVHRHISTSAHRLATSRQKISHGHRTRGFGLQEGEHHVVGRDFPVPRLFLAAKEHVRRWQAKRSWHGRGVFFTL
jgi:putative component of toxin-antitoxin plasmid stabilization module